MKNFALFPMRTDHSGLPVTGGVFAAPRSPLRPAACWCGSVAAQPFFTALRAIFFFLTALPLLLGAAEWKLAPGVSEDDGVWSFSAPAARVEMKESSNFGTSGKGYTISAAIRLRKRKFDFGTGFDADKQILYQHDFIASKGGEFVFGRRSDSWVDQLYFNYKCGGKWAVPLNKGVATPAYGQWAVVTLVAHPQYKREEGRSTTLFTLFVNGEPELRQETDGMAEKSDAPLVFGTGTGIKDEAWNFNGEIAEAVAIDRALTEDEVLELVGKSKLVKITAGAAVPLTAELTEALAAWEKSADDAETRWQISALRRAAATGSDQKKLLALVKARTSGKAWAEIPGAPQVATAGNLTLMIQEGSGETGNPLFGAFDRIAGREIFGKSTALWSAECAGKGPSHLTSSGAWSCRATGKNQWEITQSAAPHLTATLILTLKPGRLESTLAIDNRNPDIRLRTVNFPQVRFADKRAGNSTLVHPEQQGLLFSDPVRTSTPRPSWYPSGWVNMQFGAFYDDLSGLYLSPEDPAAGIKCYTVRGRGGDLECSWSIPVACDKAKHGGNSFPVNRAAIEVFKGDWFDAVLCYRRFALNRSSWSAPRKRPTPQWLMDTCLWFSHWTFKDKDFDAMPELMGSLREFFEMPFAIHWYRWYESPMPHFLAKSRVKGTQKKLHKLGVYTKAYIDTRLWSELDGPGRKSDWMFSSHGKPSAVVNEDGTWNFERYSPLCREVVMCPPSKLWQDYMLKLVERTRNDGFDMIYHDQVGASRPFPCFAKTHDHALNDPNCWTEGYRSLFARIDELNRRYPELCHDTEDANEAWLNIMDGFLTWRWSQDHQIPLFAAVYGGRVQFTGRQFDQTNRGDAGSFFAKSAGQLVQGEQIGWFTTATVLETPQRIIFTKQLAHLRKLLLGYFNGGAMERPLAFTSAPQQKKLLWGSTGSKPVPVTLPALRHGVWKNADGQRVIIWLNSDEASQSAEALLPPGSWLRCRADGTVTPLTGKTAKVQLPAYGFEVWHSGDRAEAQRIAGNLKRIGSFTAGKLMAAFNILSPAPENEGMLEFEQSPVEGAYRGKGAFVLSGDGKKSVQKKFNMPLAPNRRYLLRFAMWKAPNAKGYAAVANYSKSRKLNFYVTAGADVPSDGKWHEVKTEFSTDNEQFSTGFYLYNTKSPGKIMIDDLAVSELK